MREQCAIYDVADLEHASRTVKGDFYKEFVSEYEKLLKEFNNLIKKY